jgi:hypothetical protein
MSTGSEVYIFSQFLLSDIAYSYLSKMMDAALFETLTKNPESDVLDFKRLALNFLTNKETEDAKLVKDILCFSNTIRNETAYILYGVEESNGNKVLLGVADFPDDAILQQKVKDKVTPSAKFKSYTYLSQGLSFGVIEIPIYPHDEPLSPVIRLKGLEVGKIYIRRGSSNAEATGREVIAVSKWLETLQVEQKTADLLNDQLAILTRALADKTQPLSTSLSECLGIAIRFKKKVFESFCYHELTGYKNDFQKYGELAEHRVMTVVATPLAVELSPYHSLKGDALLRHMLTQEHFSEENFFFDRSINEMEANISWLAEKKDMALATFELSDKVMYPESNRVNGKVTLYIALSSMNTMYEKIRKIALRHLLDIHLSIVI